MSTGAGSRPGGRRSAGRGARQDRLQLPERPGKRTSSKVRSRIRTPRNPKRVQLSAEWPRKWSCPDRRERCPKGLGVIGQRRRPGGASLLAFPAPLPLVKKCVAGLDRGAGRFKERTRPGGAWRCAPRSRNGWCAARPGTGQGRATATDRGLRRERPAFGGNGQGRERETGRSVQLVPGRAHQDARARRERHWRSRRQRVRTGRKGWTVLERQRRPGGASPALPSSCEEMRGRPRSRRGPIPGEDVCNANGQSLALTLWRSVATTEPQQRRRDKDG